MSDTDEVSKPVLEGVIERGPRGRFVKGNPGPPEGKKRKKGQLCVAEHGATVEMRLR